MLKYWSGYIFTLQTIEKTKCAVGVQLARSIVNGLIHEFEELNLF